MPPPKLNTAMPPTIYEGQDQTLQGTWSVPDFTSPFGSELELGLEQTENGSGDSYYSPNIEVEGVEKIMEDLVNSPDPLVSMIFGALTRAAGTTPAGVFLSASGAADEPKGYRLAEDNKGASSPLTQAPPSEGRQELLARLARMGPSDLKALLLSEDPPMDDAILKELALIKRDDPMYSAVLNYFRLLKYGMDRGVRITRPLYHENLSIRNVAAEMYISMGLYGPLLEVMRGDSDPMLKEYALSLAADSISYGDAKGYESVIREGLRSSDPNVLWHALDIVITKLPEMRTEAVQEVSSRLKFSDGGPVPEFGLKKYVYGTMEERHMAGRILSGAMSYDMFSVPVDLGSVQPIHSLADYNPDKTLRGPIADGKYRELKALVKSYGMNREKIMAEFLSSSEDDGMPRVLEFRSGKRLLIQAHHRLAALYRAAGEGLIPADWLSNIPAVVSPYTGFEPEDLVIRALTHGTDLTWDDLLPGYAGGLPASGVDRRALSILRAFNTISGRVSDQKELETSGRALERFFTDQELDLFSSVGYSPDTMADIADRLYPDSKGMTISAIDLVERIVDVGTFLWSMEYISANSVRSLSTEHFYALRKQLLGVDPAKLWIHARGEKMTSIGHAALITHLKGLGIHIESASRLTLDDKKLFGELIIRHIVELSGEEVRDYEFAGLLKDAMFDILTPADAASIKAKDRDVWPDELASVLHLYPVERWKGALDGTERLVKLVEIARTMRAVRSIYSSELLSIPVENLRELRDALILNAPSEWISRFNHLLLVKNAGNLPTGREIADMNILLVMGRTFDSRNGLVRHLRLDLERLADQDPLAYYALARILGAANDAVPPLGYDPAPIGFNPVGPGTPEKMELISRKAIDGLPKFFAVRLGDAETADLVNRMVAGLYNLPAQAVDGLAYLSEASLVSALYKLGLIDPMGAYEKKERGGGPRGGGGGGRRDPVRQRQRQAPLGSRDKEDADPDGKISMSGPKEPN